MERINLAPNHCRQRVVIELLVVEYVTQNELEGYLSTLSEKLGMKTVDGPYIYPCGALGFGGWICRSTSGAHIYSYPPETNGTDSYLITVDAYTCKPFDIQVALQYTQDYFNTQNIVIKEI